MFYQNTYSIKIKALFFLTILLCLPTAPIKALENDSAAQFENTVQTITQTLTQLKNNLAQDDTARALRQRQNVPTFAQTQLFQLQEQFITDNDQIEADFKTVEQSLYDLQLPELLNKRHEATVEHYRTQFQTLLDHLEGIATADSFQTLGTQIDKALNLIQSQSRPRQPSFNPDQLPFSLSKAEVRAPFLNQAEFQDHYQIESKSAPTTTRSRRRRAPPSDIYLAETEEVQFTDDIVALAQTLGHRPVDIYNWVRNNIKFMPTIGATQSVQQTLDMKQGNAFDIASLLIALLRSSGIHARYVYGSIEISAPRISNWLQVNDVVAASTLAKRDSQHTLSQWWGYQIHSNGTYLG